jgi:hypothetical protein
MLRNKMAKIQDGVRRWASCVCWTHSPLCLMSHGFQLNPTARTNRRNHFLNKYHATCVHTVRSEFCGGLTQSRNCLCTCHCHQLFHRKQMQLIYTVLRAPVSYLGGNGFRNQLRYRPAWLRLFVVFLGYFKFQNSALNCFVLFIASLS